MQVCKDFASYFNDLRGHDEDIKTLSERIDDVRLNLEALKAILPEVARLESSTSPLPQEVRTQILSCHKGMDTLKATLTRIQAIGAASGFRGALQNHKQRSLYPFPKVVLQDLQRTVAEIQSRLSIALQVIGM